MTPARQAKLDIYRTVLEVCTRNGLAIGHQPPFQKAVAELAAALKALEALLAAPPPSDASYRQHEDHEDLVEAGFRSTEWALRERILPNLSVFQFNAPKFYGEMQTALAMGKRRKETKRSTRTGTRPPAVGG